MGEDRERKTEICSAEVSCTLRPALCSFSCFSIKANFFVRQKKSGKRAPYTLHNTNSHQRTPAPKVFQVKEKKIIIMKRRPAKHTTQDTGMDTNNNHNITEVEGITSQRRKRLSTANTNYKEKIREIVAASLLRSTSNGSTTPTPLTPPYQSPNERGKRKQTDKHNKIKEKDHNKEKPLKSIEIDLYNVNVGEREGVKATTSIAGCVIFFCIGLFPKYRA